MRTTLTIALLLLTACSLMPDDPVGLDDDPAATEHAGIEPTHTHASLDALTRQDRVNVAWAMAKDYGSACEVRHACHVPGTVCAGDPDTSLCLGAAIPATIIAYTEGSHEGRCDVEDPTVSEACGQRWDELQSVASMQ